MTTLNAAQLLLDATSPRITPPTVTVDFANVTGATKPADNATVNRVTYASTAPADPVDGDVWVKTTTMPHILYTRVAGVWQIAGNYVNNTTQIGDGANLGGTATWTGVTGAGKPADNADVTTTILGASGTSIVMTNANLFKSASGLGGVFIGSAGLFGKDSGGNTTFSINGSTGAAEFKGSITGGASLDITGNALFKGAASSGGFTYAGLFNTTGSASGGIRAFGSSTGAGVRGENASSGDGLFGQATSGYGVRATATTGTGLYANATGGTAINCDGPMVKTGTELVSNLNAERWGSMYVTSNTTGSATASFSGTNKPGSNSSNTWLVINAAGSTIYIPVWT
jgi:hypothetical protein